MDVVESRSFPVFVNCRDRVSCLVQLVSWLESSGYERIHLIDNASTYEPLLEYYEQTPHHVVRLGQNVGHKAPWDAGIVERFADGPYVVTDPDVVPIERCPPDAAAVLLDVLLRHPDYCKVGLGLVIDDLPDTYELAEWVVNWERQHWQVEVEPRVFDAPVDTTFAVYLPGVPFAKKPALRTGPPYMVRHLPWYVDGANLPEEERYYRAHASDSINTWNRSKLPEKLEAHFFTSPWSRLRRKLRRSLVSGTSGGGEE